ncbi:MAG: SulP family inorganic anion transporter [Gammaproteobacteria bacterium]|nr:SulP family inorganic anion transporter [Gammaproteobacteria bacterium]
MVPGRARHAHEHLQEIFCILHAFRPVDTGGMRGNGVTQLTYDLRTFRGDLFGGITATVVVFPAALAFGMASGLGAAAGIYGSIAVGFFAAVFGGTRTQISGPTGPMAVATAVIVASHASTLSEALAIVVLGGLLQALLGLTRIGRFVAYTPRMVISGFMSGIGIIIIVIQLAPLLGAPAVGGPIESMNRLPSALSNVNFSAVTIGVLSLVIAALWPRRLSTYLPGPVVALIIGTLLGVLWLHDAPVLGPVPVGMPAFALELPSAGFLLRALEPALILALLGSVDSLLTSLIADTVTGTRHEPNRELVGQGIGNMMAGMFGGMPGAGNTLGTLTNIHAGGTTRVSGATYAVLMLALVFGLGDYIEPIPRAVLAGVLIKIGLDIIDWQMLARIHRMRLEHALVMLVTLGITVFVDLVTAVALGLIAAGLTHARQLENLELDSVVSVPLLDRNFFGLADGVGDPYAARTGLIALKGIFTVASSHRLVGAFSIDIQKHDVVIFDFSDTSHVDDSAAVVVAQLMNAAVKADTELIVVGLSGEVLETLRTFNILRHVPAGRSVKTMDEAREIARALLRIGADD